LRDAVDREFYEDDYAGKLFGKSFGSVGQGRQFGEKFPKVAGSF
jgi:hypothetical protein